MLYSKFILCAGSCDESLYDMFVRSLESQLSSAQATENKSLIVAAKSDAQDGVLAANIKVGKISETKR